MPESHPLHPILRRSLSAYEQGVLSLAARDETRGMVLQIAGIKSQQHADRVIAEVRAKAARLLRAERDRLSGAGKVAVPAGDARVPSEQDRTMREGVAGGTPPTKSPAAPESFPSPFPDVAPPIAVEAAIELAPEVEGWFDGVRELIERAVQHRASEAEFAELSERLICGPPAR